MMSPVLRTYHHSDRHFLSLFALSWLGFYAAGVWLAEVSFTHAAISAAFAAVCSLFILRMLGYFSPLRLFPRRSDVLLLLLAMPAAGLLQVLLLNFVLQSEYACVWCFMVAAPILSVAVFSAHYWYSRLLLKGGARRKIILDLPLAERTHIAQEYLWKGVARYIDFLSLKDLKQHLLEGRIHEISLIVMSQRGAAKFEADGALIRAHLAGVPILDYRMVATELSGRVLLGESDLWAYLMQATPQTRLLRLIRLTKIITEPIVAAVLLVLLAPVMLVVAALVKATSAGPVFYYRTRTGYLGKTFRLIKFRSMIADAETTGPQWAAQDDKRFTRLGRYLRRTRLDELPQLWNVIRGEMSFVGPRPERPEIYARLKEALPLFPMRLVLRPGITGWAQVWGGYASSPEQSRDKLEYDLFYIQHMSPRLDLVIILKTILVLFGGGTATEKEAEKSAAAVVA